jgi:hypothetical protein
LGLSQKTGFAAGIAMLNGNYLFKWWSFKMLFYKVFFSSFLVMCVPRDMTMVGRGSTERGKFRATK